MTRSEFIAAVAPVAVKVRVDGGPLFPSVSIAQMLLETGGRLNSWNNLVGYKVGDGVRTPYWDGKAVSKTTWEVYDGRIETPVADFRAYPSIEYCLKDQALLFYRLRQRYQRVIDAKTPKEQAEMLQAYGYATDPNYASKIWAIIRSDQLEKHDREAEKAVEALKELAEQVAKLRREVEALQKRGGMGVPPWAKEAVDAAVRAKLIDTPEGGSFDFYRLVTILHRAGLIPEAE
ncbi:MAG: muramidase (flagellum-specific) [Paenibacillaceae bacterium ZCTH02-B3]|nr:MAG: muramidase (flagellum-specific) [Paenibacillaceae bacterium ZCTH02-B3]